MTRRACAAAILGVALLALGIGPARGADDPIRQALEDAKPARRPFRGLTATRIRVGTRTLHVVVADDVDERTQGLRQRRDVRPYDGMLFAFEAPTRTSFTMSTVPVALDIGFYDGSGRVVDRLRMEPCARSESQCPVYRASGAFRYSLETPAGDLPPGRLRGVTPSS